MVYRDFFLFNAYPNESNRIVILLSRDGNYEKITSAYFEILFN